MPACVTGTSRYWSGRSATLPAASYCVVVGNAPYRTYSSLSSNEIAPRPIAPSTAALPPLGRDTGRNQRYRPAYRWWAYRGSGSGASRLCRRRSRNRRRRPNPPCSVPGCSTCRPALNGTSRYWSDRSATLPAASYCVVLGNTPYRTYSSLSSYGIAAVQLHHQPLPCRHLDAIQVEIRSIGQRAVGGRTEGQGRERRVRVGADATRRCRPNPPCSVTGCSTCRPASTALPGTGPTDLRPCPPRRTASWWAIPVPHVQFVVVNGIAAVQLHHQPLPCCHLNAIQVEIRSIGQRAVGGRTEGQGRERRVCVGGSDPSSPPQSSVQRTRM